MININNAVLRRGSRKLLDQTSLVIHAEQKVGVVGRNGSGKTSLFACLQGELSLDEGALEMPDGLRIAAMEQETGGSSRSALDHVIDGDRRLRELENDLARAEQAGRQQAVANLHDEIDRIDGYTAVNRAERLLAGLGFSADQFDNPVSSFSGGWRVRLNLAAALMCPSDLLLLDEPTNHLDLEANVWLEQWLTAYAGTLLMISHDRAFLDRIVSSIISFEGDKLRLYRGNFSAFEKQKAERLALQQAMGRKQQKRRAEIESFVNRFRAKASKARQAQSRLRELERMEEIAVAHIDSPYLIQFPAAKRYPDHLLQVKDLTVGFEHALLSDVHLAIRSDTRIGLLGVNGSGKSTLLKVLAGELAPLAGELIGNRHLQVGYFAQHQVDVLDSESTPLSLLLSLDEKTTEQQARDYLGGFDFAAERVTARIGNFSGGEKVRLALAVIAWQRPNLLLLDEPTNHLDLDMRQALTESLQAFEGAIIIVAHDRHLLNNTVDEFYHIEHGKLHLFRGDLADYERLVQAGGNAADRGADSEPMPASGNRKSRRQEAAQRREELAPLRRELSGLERRMETLHDTLVKLEADLQESTLYDEANRNRLAELLRLQGMARAELKQVEEQWLELGARLEEAAAADG